jgi:hypothetical protein
MSWTMKTWNVCFPYRSQKLCIFFYLFTLLTAKQQENGGQYSIHIFRWVWKFCGVWKRSNLSQAFESSIVVNCSVMNKHFFVLIVKKDARFSLCSWHHSLSGLCGKPSMFCWPAWSSGMINPKPFTELKNLTRPLLRELVVEAICHETTRKGK